MVEISLTEFVDFVIRSGSPKLTVVRTVKKRHEEGYSPKSDFYKKLREGIVSFHKDGKPKTALDSIATGLSDQKKRDSYPILLQGYRKFLGRKKIEWFEPLKKKWECGHLAVRVNPELGLRVKDAPYLVKMYFKQEGLTAKHVACILHLLQLALTSKKTRRGIGLLDVRRGRLITAPEFDASLTPLLQGEALSFASIYESI